MKLKPEETKLTYIQDKFYVPHIYFGFNERNCVASPILKYPLYGIVSVGLWFEVLGILNNDTSWN
jgi:hypothetical protein